MGELLGCLLGGWIWVALGRAVGSRASWNTDKVTVAGLVASAALVVALVLARHYGADPDKLVVYGVGHAGAAVFWLWRYAVSLRRAASIGRVG